MSLFYFSDINMYIVLKITTESPKELETVLNTICDKDNIKLIAVDNGYYIFESNKK